VLPIVLPTRPYSIASETWLIPTLAADPGGGCFSAHTLVIRGQQPVIVDTGCRLVRDQWTEQVFSVVDPLDVRWVFLSHDDHDHIGNLDVVLEHCPNATLVANFSIVARLIGDVELPLHRMRWVDAGQSFDVGDRALVAVRPPMFDSPATRGLFDPTTGLLWGVDSFGSNVPGEVYEAVDVPAEMFDASFAVMNAWNTPWLEWADRDRFARHLAQSRSLPIEVIASAHGPLLRGDRIDDAFERTLGLVGQTPPPTPGNETLDLLASLSMAPAMAVA
jgi:flavorubredoxin